MKFEEVKTMDIHSKEGAKVKVTLETLENGRPYDQGKIHSLLQLEKVYTVQQTIVHQSITDVRLEEVPNVVFNSVNFVNVFETEEERLRDQLKDNVDKADIDTLVYLIRLFSAHEELYSRMRNKK